ncbi:MAG: TonB-dependent receptor [Candidatus Krumholzibacteriota bacterium]
MNRLLSPFNMSGLKVFLPVALLLVLTVFPATAQVGSDTAQPQAPGTIKGRIFDAESGESMPYTNVFISGTNIGTMAFTDGFYIIKGLRPGTYTIKASYISYGVGSKTVVVGPGEVKNIDFHLEVQAIMADPLEIQAERALVEVDRTGSSHYITSREMEAMPLDQMVDLIATTPGVTLQDNEIHIRGGRADDTMFVVDGMSVNDPLAGGGYGYSIDPSLINEIEVLTGGFNAEYGQAVSGVVNVSTKEGSEKFEGRVSVKRDYLIKTHPSDVDPGWRNLTDYSHPNNIDIVKMSMSGQDPISAGLKALGVNMPGTQFILASASLDTRDGYLPIYGRKNKLQSPIYTDQAWSPRQQNNWNGLLKWTWNFTPHHKLNINLTRNVNIDQGFFLPGEGYPFLYMDNLDNWLVFTNENILSQAYYRQVLNENSWFELTLGRNFNRQHNNINGNDDFTTYTTVGEAANSDPGEALNARYLYSADRWHDHFTESWTGKGSYSFMGLGNNRFKTGFEVSFTEMQLINLQGYLGRPPPGKLALNEDVFWANPITAAGYFQDTIEYRGLIINAGIRGDLWAPGKEVETVMANPDDYIFITPDMAEEFNSSTFRLAGRNWKARLSPRIGLSFPVTERDKFFFNYGHFSQWARFAYVYPQLQAQTVSNIPLLGNPNLDPKVTVEYETGLQHEFGGLWSLGLTFFNRDIYGYAKAVKLDPVEISHNETPDPNDTDTITIRPVRYFNGDSARSLGIEMTVIKRTTRWLSGSGSFELQSTTGTNSNADEAYLQARYEEAYQPQASLGGLSRNPLVWDKPWSASLNLDFSVFETDRPHLFGWRMPQNWSINVLFRAEAGQRYTPLTWSSDDLISLRDDNSYFSKTGPWRSQFNFRLNKFWKLGKGQKLTFYIDFRNILNHRNYRRINPYTGRGYEIGDYNPSWEYGTNLNPVEGQPYYSTDSELYAKTVVNPSHIENPRILMWGVSYSW